MDYEGHGKSSGLQGYVPCFDDVVDDCSDFFTSICGKHVYPRFYFILFSPVILFGLYSFNGWIHVFGENL